MSRQLNMRPHEASGLFLPVGGLFHVRVLRSKLSTFARNGFWKIIASPYKNLSVASSMNDGFHFATMNQFDSKDYYAVLGCDREASQREIERRYKRLASRHHPDRGGDEDEMKSLNEAYAVLKDDAARRDYDSHYDSQRQKPFAATFTPASTPPARDVGAHGQSLSALLCLLAGLFLLFLVRFQWIWFLWPLVILAVFVIVFGVLLAHGAMLSLNEAQPASSPIRGRILVWEALFWTIIGVAGYGIYLLLTA